MGAATWLGPGCGLVDCVPSSHVGPLVLLRDPGLEVQCSLGLRATDELCLQREWLLHAEAVTLIQIPRVWEL